MQLWLTQFDRGELDEEEAAASTVVEYEAHIAALERKVDQLTMELDLLKKMPRLCASAWTRFPCTCSKYWRGHPAMAWRTYLRTGTDPG
jgi:transposase-like protein